MAKRISPTPSGTVEGGAVYPLASNVAYEQSVQPVTIVSSLDTKGKQQPFTLAPNTGIVNSFGLQGSPITCADGASIRTDNIDCSLHDSLIFYISKNNPIVAGTLEIDIIAQGTFQAEDGTNITLDNSSTTNMQIKHNDAGLLFTDILNDPDQDAGIGADNYYQYKVTDLHGLLIAVLLKNDSGGSLDFTMFHKLVNFRGA